MGHTDKETPAQRIERIKREKAPWSILEEIKQYAREGFDSIPDDDLHVRFKHWGIYTQGDGGGVRGKAVPHFMMRVRTPNGLLTANQVHKIATISEQYCRSSLDVTTRQNFQLHWIRIEDLPTIWEELASVGLISQGSCGDNTRTVTGCPLSGVDHDEIVDAAPLALELDRYFNGNDDFANLPRKFKITVTGCAHWCTYPEINDVGLTAVRRGSEVGFHMRVGGGLATRPHLAIPLNAFIPWEQVLPVVRAAVEIFRESDVLRESRQKARLKFLFLDHGWTAERFLAEIQRRIGSPLEPAIAPTPPEDTYRDHVGILPQKQDGLFYAGFSVPRGRITPTQAHQIADLADVYGDGRVRATAMQNLLILGISEAHIRNVQAGAAALGIPLRASPFQRGTISCTGSEYCKLAITETKGFSERLITDMERRFPGFTDEVKIHVTGCPNSCGQHWIADIGLQGVSMKVDDKVVDGYDFFVGGGLGATAAFARRVGYRSPASHVSDALERLFSAYCQTRKPQERFPHWAARHDVEALESFLRSKVG